MRSIFHNVALWSPKLICVPTDIFRGKDSEVIRVKEDEGKLEVSLDTAQYRPDELKVSVEGGAVSVEGRHEEKAEDGTRMVSRSFNRENDLTPGA